MPLLLQVGAGVSKLEMNGLLGMLSNESSSKVRERATDS